jgi:hypothetical protein
MTQTIESTLSELSIVMKKRGEYKFAPFFPNTLYSVNNTRRIAIHYFKAALALLWYHDK